MKIQLTRFFLLFTAFVSIHAFQLHAQSKATKVSKFDITFKIDGIQENDTCLLAYYLGQKQYIKDTLIAGKGGVVKYKSEGETEAGIYLFVSPDMQFFEFILTEPVFTIESKYKDGKFIPEENKSKGSKENELFFAFNAKMSALRSLREKLNEEKKAAEGNDAKLKELDNQLIGIDDQAREATNSTIDNNKGLFVSKLLNAAREIEVPDPAPGMTDEEEKLWRYYYIKKHYLDNIDFSDDRLLRTPIMHTKVMDYLDRLTVKNPDSVIVSADFVLDKAAGNYEVFKYFVITITNKFSNTKVMCMDKVYVHMAGKYYVSGRADWIESDQLEKIKDRYYHMVLNTCGNIATNLVATDANGKQTHLFGVDAKYTILIFWAYDCGHCKKEMPKFAELLKEYRKHGVEIFTMCTKDNEEEWKKFIEEKNMGEMINTFDAERQNKFSVIYDVYSTPVVYILDKDKRIIAKRIDVENAKLLLNHELGIEEAPQNNN